MNSCQRREEAFIGPDRSRLSFKVRGSDNQAYTHTQRSRATCVTKCFVIYRRTDLIFCPLDATSRMRNTKFETIARPS